MTQYSPDIRYLIKNIEEDLANNNCGLISRTKSYIYIDDYLEDKRIRFHLTKPTERWTSYRIHYGPKAQNFRCYHQSLITALLKTDQNMLITLEHVFIINGPSDAEFFCAKYNIDPDELPEQVTYEPNTISNTIGVYWWAANSVFINIEAIHAALEEIKKDYDTYDLFFDYCTHEHDGIIRTLLHEIRHLGLANPFLDETKYPPSYESEQAVEDWASEEYERIFGY